MAFLQANIYSSVLGMEVLMNVILPQQTKKVIGKSTRSVQKDIPVIYLLHGMQGNHSVWARRTSIERYASEEGFALIMPSTDLGWYTDTTYDMNYWTFISEELPAICHELFPQLTKKREKTFAAGLSMGGYGAIKLGLRKPKQFAAVASLSGVLALAESMEVLATVRPKAYWEGIFGPTEELSGSDNDLIHLVKTSSAKKMPKFFIACGTEDPLYPVNTYMVETMEANKFPVTYEEGAGMHAWDFWDEWIQRVLKWFKEVGEV